MITVRSVGSGFVMAEVPRGCPELKIWKGAIVKVLPRQLQRGDKVRTTGGKIGTIERVDGDEISITFEPRSPQTEPTVYVYDRCAIRKVIERAEDMGQGGGED